MFDLQFETDNDAFLEPGAEISRILRSLGDVVWDKIAGGGTTGPVFDINGNKVGSWIFQEED